MLLHSKSSWRQMACFNVFRIKWNFMVMSRSNICWSSQESSVSCVSAERALIIFTGHSDLIGVWLAIYGWPRIALTWTNWLCSTCPHFLSGTPGLSCFLEAMFQDRADKCTKALRSTVTPIIFFWTQQIKNTNLAQIKVEE